MKNLTKALFAKLVGGEPVEFGKCCGKKPKIAFVDSAELGFDPDGDTFVDAFEIECPKCGRKIRKYTENVWCYRPESVREARRKVLTELAGEWNAEALPKSSSDGERLAARIETERAELSELLRESEFEKVRRLVEDEKALAVLGALNLV